MLLVIVTIRTAMPPVVKASARVPSSALSDLPPQNDELAAESSSLIGYAVVVVMVLWLCGRCQLGSRYGGLLSLLTSPDVGGCPPHALTKLRRTDLGCEQCRFYSLLQCTGGDLGGCRCLS